MSADFMNIRIDRWHYNFILEAFLVFLIYT